MLAAMNGRDVALFDAEGTAINEKDNDGWTALIHAADNGHETTVDRLINLQANVDAASNSGITALMKAVCHSSNYGDEGHLMDYVRGYVGIVRKLLRAGATVNKDMIARAAGNPVIRTLLQDAMREQQAQLINPGEEGFTSQYAQESSVLTPGNGRCPCP